MRRLPPSRRGPPRRRSGQDRPRPVSLEDPGRQLREDLRRFLRDQHPLALASALMLVDRGEDLEAALHDLNRDLGSLSVLDLAFAAAQVSISAKSFGFPVRESELEELRRCQEAFVERLIRIRIEALWVRN